MNVRPGDLAIVVGCEDTRFNGATCEVVGEPSSLLAGEQVIGQHWLVRFARPMAWTYLTDEGLLCINDRRGNFPDRWLRKIGGPEAAEGVLRQGLREMANAMKEPA